VNSQKLILIICVFVAVPLSLFSQTYSVSGTVYNENNLAISYANVYVAKSIDSVYTNTKGSTSNEEGFFEIKDLEPGTYRLTVSFLGYQAFTKELNLDTNINLNSITLSQKTEELSEIKVTAVKPTLKRETGKLIFNVEKTALTEGNVWDILKSTPGILMINDEISVKNSSNIIYLVNDKRVYLSGSELQQLLSGTSANSVNAIEVITNPSAKYDAEGGAVINIKMSKNLIAGYNGSLYSNYTQGIYPRVNAGTGHFFKGKKTSLYLGY